MDIYIGSIPFKWKEKNIEELFSPYCKVSKVTIIIDKITRQNKGFGFVGVDDEDAALKAIKVLNNQEIEGRQIVVSLSTPKVKNKNRDSKSHSTVRTVQSSPTKPKNKLPLWLRK